MAIQAIDAHRNLVVWIRFTAGGVADRDLALTGRYRGCRTCRATALRRRDDIARMIAVTVQSVDADRDLIVRSGRIIGSMADRDLAIANYHGARGATAHGRRYQVVGMAHVNA